MLNSVSTATLLAIPRNAVSTIQSRLTDAESEASSGIVADPIRDLGSKAGLNQLLQAQSTTLSNFQSTNSIASANLTSTQNTLSSIYSDAQTFLNALITAQSTGTVSTLQAQAQSSLTALTSALNTSVGGAYLFGGINNTTKPISDYSTSAQAATASAFQNAFGTSQSSSSAGSISSSAMTSFLTGDFANLFSGANWSTNISQASSTAMSSLISPTLSVTTSSSANDAAFQKLYSAYVSIADLGIDSLSASTQQTLLKNAVSVASEVMQGVSDIQTSLGLSQSQITNADTSLKTQASYIDDWVSQLQQVDPAKASTDLSSLKTQLETAYSLTNSISKLSLVNYLST